METFLEEKKIQTDWNQSFSPGHSVSLSWVHAILTLLVSKQIYVLGDKEREGEIVDFFFWGRGGGCFCVQ